MTALTPELKTKFTLASACLGVGHDADVVRKQIESALVHVFRSPVIRGTTAEEKFNALAAKWDSETGHMSSIGDMALNSAYQRIIGMGVAAVPFLLREMELRPNHWHWALNAITEQNPVPEEHYGRLDLIAKDWVKWGREQGYRW